MTRRALVVCHHVETRRTLSHIAECAGLAPLTAVDGERALYLSGEHLFDAVVIALALPGIDAEDVCRELRRRGRTAILVVSAGGEERRLAALDAGADDHVDVPFHPREIEARLRSLVRRTAGSLAVDRSVRLGPLVVRLAKGAGVIGDVGEQLEPEAATVLGALAERAGCIVASSALRERLAARHGSQAADHLDHYVARLTGVLDAAGAPSVQAVHGVGYVLRR